MMVIELQSGTTFTEDEIDEITKAVIRLLANMNFSYVMPKKY